LNTVGYCWSSRFTIQRPCCSGPTNGITGNRIQATDYQTEKEDNHENIFFDRDTDSDPVKQLAVTGMAGTGIPLSDFQQNPGVVPERHEPFPE
jgi:hypothetical protein